MNHAVAELINDVLPNWIYNSTTGRFVRGSLQFGQELNRSSAPKIPASYVAWCQAHASVSHGCGAV